MIQLFRNGITQKVVSCYQDFGKTIVINQLSEIIIIIKLLLTEV